MQNLTQHFSLSNSVNFVLIQHNFCEKFLAWISTELLHEIFHSVISNLYFENLIRKYYIKIKTKHWRNFVWKIHVTYSYNILWRFSSSRPYNATFVIIIFDVLSWYGVCVECGRAFVDVRRIAQRPTSITHHFHAACYNKKM